jgi:L,D-transpeptidase-like protein
MDTSPQALLERARSICSELPDTFVLVDIDSQTLALFDGDRDPQLFTVSTSRFGTGSQVDSFRTPTGKHRVAERIGGNALPGAIFERRADTLRVWDGERRDEDLVLTRILRLAGLEDGHNRGPGIDSFDRYIYIHGTNHEDDIGTPASHGCVRMRNNDIVTLFDQVSEGILVLIR